MSKGFPWSLLQGSLHINEDYTQPLRGARLLLLRSPPPAPQPVPYPSSLEGNHSQSHPGGMKRESLPLLGVIPISAEAEYKSP